ncbi:hypothetical protein H2248_009444 [Termitomyces sp. 'cryptogamus']|nr:hypothetical protein H2248_009444 [Termitomyces sp. 'cryptogamus']
MTQIQIRHDSSMIPSTPTSRSHVYVPAIDTDITHDSNIPVASSTSSCNDISSPQAGIFLTSPATLRTQPTAHKVHPTDRARTESRKLFAHVLDQLHRRTLPPGIFDAFNHPEVQGPENSLGLLLQTVKGAVVNPKKIKQDGKRQAPMGIGEDDSDEDGEREFSTDATYDLMLQLKDLLSVSMDRNWHILDDNPTDHQNDGYYESSEKSGISPFLRTRNNLQPVGQRPRSLSPLNSDQKRMRTPELLSSCISVLASVVLEDCRYQIAFPRPSCPPNALQALALDVAQFLLHAHRHDPIVISNIGFTMIPAFSTFRPEMHGRLLNFFETAVIRGVLEDLEHIQGTIDIASNPNYLQKPLNNKTSSSVAIHIDEVQETPYRDSGFPRWKPWSLSPDSVLKMQSTYASSQSPALYPLSSLVSPLLATILEFVDLEPKQDARTDLPHRFSRLLRLIIETKPDAYSDLLQLVGYHTQKARRAALGILCALWPKAVGHIGISKPFEDFYTVEDTHPNEHQFVPWRFPTQSSSLDPNGFSSEICRSCAQPIRDFGLLCTLCTCKVHFDCYDHPNGSKLIQYSLVSDHNIQRMAVYRFSPIVVERNQPKLKGSSNQNLGHHFRPVNLFTLCLCIICRQPLWGCTSQGLNCSSCMLCVHRDCLTHPSASSGSFSCSSSILTSDMVDINWNELHHSCMVFYQDILQLSYSDLEMLSFEEISVLHSTVWTQAQIIRSGIALGSIVVTRNGTTSANDHLEEFELHHIMRWCEDLLVSGRQQRSNAMDDYMEVNSLTGSEYFMMFDWTTLMYIRTILRSPCIEHQIPHGSSSDLLSVSQPGASITYSPEVSSSPFEMVPLSHMRDSLGHGLNIYSDVLAQLLLSYLHHLGLFERMDYKSRLFNGDDVTRVYCLFPLPFYLDLSPTVEALVAAVEGCLQDLDFSVAEVGFLLLVRRLWPNGLASEYIFQRLTRCIISWILAEDDHLATILRDYLAKGRHLPGVRSPQDPALWPSDKSRPPPSGLNNGGDYLATRRALLLRYAKPWLLALHDLDSVAYASFIYDACLDAGFSPNSAVQDVKMEFANDQAKKDFSARHDKVLRQIIRLSQVHVIFTAFNNLFLHWLESTSRGPLKDSFHSLPRLFPREGDTNTNIYSEPVDLPMGNAPVDPWQTIIRMAGEGSQEPGRCLQWLYLFAHSGVDIPLTVFETFSALVKRVGISLANSLLLAKAILVSTWLKPKGRQEIQSLISQLHERLRLQIMNALKSKEPDKELISFVRITLASCLLLYGCDRAKLQEFSIILDIDISTLPSRRKMNVRASMVVDPVVIDPRLMVALDHYMTAESEDVSCLVGKFLYLFLTGSSYMETYEVDNFILRNGRCLANYAWKLYDIQRPEVFELRAHFLLRNLVVDSEPFRNILETNFLPTSHWERRFLAINRLFKVVLDVISPSFDLEDCQWRPSLADVFYYFFTSLWADSREEIRIAAGTCSATLLPAHFQAITTCWNELLSKSPIAERLKLISFLAQLRSYFPRWQVLSWDAIIEALAEHDYDESDPAAAHLSLYGFPSTNSTNDPELVKLRVSVVFLALQMIADGIQIDSFALLKIKTHLVNVIGFPDVLLVPSQVGRLFQIQFGEVSEINDIAFPCVNQLLSVMDASHTVDIPSYVMAGSNDLDERPVSILVGSAFIDVFLVMFCSVKDLNTLPILTCKNMLETLCIVIYKHDFESRVLKHLQQALRRAVMRALDCLAQDISYDLRQLALYVVNAFVKRWHSIMGSFIYTAVEAIAKLVASHSQHHSQDALFAQAKAFLDASFIKYAQNGLFANLLKRQLHRDFFLVLKQVTDNNVKDNPTAPQSLCELLLRDVLIRVTDVDHVSFQNVLNNTRAYVEVVYHEGFNSELMQFIGQQFIQISRRAAEWNPENMNPDPLLITCAIIVHHNKALSRDILSSTDTVLRVLSSRLNVGTEALSRLLQATSSLHRRTTKETSVTNVVLNSLLEILSDGLRSKVRVLPSTLNSIIEALMTTETPGGFPPVISHLSSFLDLVEPAVHFIQNHPWQDVEKDFAASLAAARLILQASTQDPNIMDRLSDYGIEKAAHINLKVRSWSILAIAALLEQKENWHTALFAQLSTFSYAYHGSIRTYSQGIATSSESAVIDLNYAYIAIKLWILLAYKVSGTGDIVKDSQTLAVWNELWPPFEGFLDQFELDSSGALYLAVGTLVMSSVAELLIFMRTLHTPIVLDVSAHITTLNRLRQLGPGDTLNQKLTRALQYMLEPPPEMQFETLVNQAAKDVVAAEKLRISEARVAPDRKTLERYRRDMRATT